MHPVRGNRLSETAFTRRDSRFGPIIIFWSELQDRPSIERVLLGVPEKYEETVIRQILKDSRHLACPEIERTADDIQAFLAGEDIRFALDRIRLDLCPDFQRRVLIAEHGVPRGRVTSYHSLAKFLGKAAASRAVGSALARNPFPIIIPCHRAIKSDRTLGGFQGGLRMKHSMLEAEGIRFDSKNRVMTSSFFYS